MKNISIAGLPEKLPEELMQQNIAWLEEHDKDNSLELRKNHLAAMFTITELLEINRHEADFFEAGSRIIGKTFPDEDLFYNGSVAWFFAANPDLVKYKGYDPENYKWTGQLKKIPEEKTQLEGMLEQQVRNYKTFSMHILHSDNAVIFSNHTMSCPYVSRRKDFWNLPGIQIHSTGAGDIYEMWLQKQFPVIHANNRYERKTIGTQDYYEDVPTLFKKEYEPMPYEQRNQRMFKEIFKLSAEMKTFYLSDKLIPCTINVWINR